LSHTIYIAMTASVTIHCRDVVKRYGDHVALDHIDLAIETGTSLGLLGKSGAGKSTLLRIIAGLDDPTAGSVAFAADDSGTALVPKIGMVFQNLSLWPHLSARQHIEAVLHHLGRSERRTRAELSLDEMKLPRRAWDRPPGELSGGEAQRLAIARALVIDPNVLLFDEPLAHVDEDLRNELVELLEGIVRSRSVTTIYVTHSPSEARRMADRIAVIEQGRLKQIDAPGC
jgi:ABC-type sugar transport system ATPase subunit